MTRTFTEAHGLSRADTGPICGDVSRREFLGVAMALAIAGCTVPLLPDPGSPVEIDRTSAEAQLRTGVVRKLAEAYTGWPFEPDLVNVSTRFDDYFGWWAAVDAGRRDYYDSVAADLEAGAYTRHAKRFVECTPAECIEVARASFGAGSRKRYERDMRGPILDVYVQTYAWIDMGYAGFPSVPRGLEAYRQPVPRASA